MSIREIAHIIKGYAQREDIIIPAVIILVGFGSFGLGRLSLLAEQKDSVVIRRGMTADAAAQPPYRDAAVSNTQGAQHGTQEASIIQAGGLFVGSRNGIKYHYPWCPGAERIKEENRVWFSSREEAERAGYTPASNCKGL